MAGVAGTGGRVVAGPAPSLVTARLLLRTPSEADIPDIVGQANDWAVARRLGRLPHPYGEADAHHFLAHVVPKELAWAICSRTDGTFMGCIGLTPEPAGDAAELGYWLGRRFWGWGFATEAGAAVVAHAVTELRLPRLTSGYFTDNAASGRVLSKLGFVQAGCTQRPCLAVGRPLPLVAMVFTPDRRSHE